MSKSKLDNRLRQFYPKATSIYSVPRSKRKLRIKKKNRHLKLNNLFNRGFILRNIYHLSDLEPKLDQHILRVSLTTVYDKAQHFADVRSKYSMGMLHLFSRFLKSNFTSYTVLLNTLRVLQRKFNLYKDTRTSGLWLGHKFITDVNTLPNVPTVIPVTEEERDNIELLPLMYVMFRKKRLYDARTRPLYLKMFAGYFFNYVKFRDELLKLMVFLPPHLREDLKKRLRKRKDKQYFFDLLPDYHLDRKFIEMRYHFIKKFKKAQRSKKFEEIVENWKIIYPRKKKDFFLSRTRRGFVRMSLQQRREDVAKVRKLMSRFLRKPANFNTFPVYSKWYDKKIGVMNVKRVRTNVFISLCDLEGKVVKSMSAGQISFGNNKRNKVGTPTVIELFRRFIPILNKHDIKGLRFFMLSKRLAPIHTYYKAFTYTKIQAVDFTYAPGIPHSLGLRKKKKRRL